MDIDKAYATFTHIILAASRVDAMIGTALLSLIKIEELNQRVFFHSEIVGPLSADRKANLLCTYLKNFRPTFFEEHKKLFQEDLKWLRELRNKCGHGILTAGDDPPEDRLLSIHAKIELKKRNPEQVHIKQSDVDRVVRIEADLYPLILGPVFDDSDEILLPQS